MKSENGNVNSQSKRMVMFVLTMMTTTMMT